MADTKIVQCWKLEYLSVCSRGPLQSDLDESDRLES
jgi:hypothetical protein